MSLTGSFMKPHESDPFEPGIFCDVHGTLVSPERPDLVDYLNRQYEAGKRVTIFSSNSEDAVNDIAHLNLHPDLKNNVQPKGVFIGRVLDVIIDDHDPSDALLMCRTHLDPAKTDFQGLMPGKPGLPGPKTP